MPHHTQSARKPEAAFTHPGPLARGKRVAAAMTMSEAAFKTKVDIGKLSKFERAIGNLTPDEQRRLDDILSAAVHDRSRALEAVLALDRDAVAGT
jgi:hypothetical protein